MRSKVGARINRTQPTDRFSVFLFQDRWSVKPDEIRGGSVSWKKNERRTAPVHVRRVPMFYLLPWIRSRNLRPTSSDVTGHRQRPRTPRRQFDCRAEHLSAYQFRSLLLHWPSTFISYGWRRYCYRIISLPLAISNFTTRCKFAEFLHETHFTRNIVFFPVLLFQLLVFRYYYLN